MVDIVEIISKIGIFIILGIKSCFFHISECFSSCIGIFSKVTRLKNPEQNFKDFNQFVKLVTDDSEFEDEPGLLTDEQVQRLVNESMSQERKKKRPRNNDFYDDEEEGSGLKDEEDGETVGSEETADTSDILKKLKKETRKKLMEKRGLSDENVGNEVGQEPEEPARDESPAPVAEVDILGGGDDEDDNLLI